MGCDGIVGEPSGREGYWKGGGLTGNGERGRRWGNRMEQVLGR